jgi:hypothetical protein
MNKFNINNFDIRHHYCDECKGYILDVGVPNNDRKPNKYAKYSIGTEVNTDLQNNFNMEHDNTESYCSYTQESLDPLNNDNKILETIDYRDTMKYNKTVNMEYLSVKDSNNVSNEVVNRYDKLLKNIKKIFLVLWFRYIN